MFIRSLFLLVPLALSLDSCKCGSENKNQQPEGQAVTTSTSGLKIEVLKPGDGDVAKSGMKATVHYTGTLEDGTKFDSSLDRNLPFTFNLGRGEVIKGWDEGVEGMKVGEKRKLTVPPDLGYGERGRGGIIPPNAKLIFEIELIKVEN
ncbi:MAG: FKBP-type peptidyl-prolyl cis-trans isomerase [Oligoflexales bacterium]|nr:FKBP-type peptidyl-prolyl cis-trans isomerase [Oligoflexales bacterium]